MPSALCSLVLFVSLVVSFGARLVPLEPGALQQRIIGGKNAIPSQFPFYAFIRMQSTNDADVGACGGSLVSPNYILTAAHCCKCQSTDTGLTFTISLNLYHADIWTNQGIPDTCTEVHTSTLADRTCYPGYVPDQFPYSAENDFCLIRLSTPSVYPPAVLYNSDVIHLSPSQQPEAAKFPLLIAGFGMTGVAQVISSTLQKAIITVADNTQCVLNYQTNKSVTFDPNLIICGNTSTGEDTCQGDSGGPLFAKLSPPSNQFLLVGITSVGPANCADPNLFGIYNPVDRQGFKDWAYPILGLPSPAPTRPTRQPVTGRPTKPPPTSRPSRSPTTKTPTQFPSFRPTKSPTSRPTTRIPTVTRYPTAQPTPKTKQPSKSPTTKRPSQAPTLRTNKPSKSPTIHPSRSPTTQRPTKQPTFPRSCISNAYP